MNDLIVPSTSCEKALEGLRIVLDVASQYGLVINWEKCSFMQTRVEYLGHIVENSSIRPTELKTVAVSKFPAPTNVRSVQSFLDLTGYFRKYIPQYSLIARPLTDLLKANTIFVFGDEEKEAFERLKMILVSGPVLKLYKIGVETELHTDGCMYGFDAILVQRDIEDNMMHPVYYASGKTTAAEEKYSSYELEVLAIVKSLRKFRVYFLGIPFKIITNCQAFTMTMRKRDLCVRIARWAVFLEDFNYTIEHRSGKKMSHVDALSRNSLPTSLVIDEDEESITTRIKVAQNKDENVMRIIDAVSRNQNDKFLLRRDLLFKNVDDRQLLVVPKSMQTQVIRRAHDKGHFSIAKTEALIKRDFWFGRMQQKIEKIVQNCISCILSNKKQGKQGGFLNPIDKGDVPLDTYHIDHLGPLPVG